MLLRRERGGGLSLESAIGKPYWGKGIATCALSAFLEHNKGRPLYARAAADNAASLRVLEKCGFVRIGTNRDFANARGQEIEEVLLKLP
jgi:RimJ/RimL family protein N-acetyltransferase